MLNVVDDAPRVALDRTCYRLIPSRFPPVSIYEGVVPSERIAELVEIENVTNPRLKAVERLGAAARAASATGRLQNWNHAPFAYSNPEGTFFFPPDRPCLELAMDRQTALVVSIARRQRFLGRTAEPPIGLDMRMLVTPVKGVFLDVSNVGGGLSPQERRAIGEKVPADVDGIIYRAQERPSAQCVAVLKGSVLGPSVQAAHYRYAWNGHQVTSLYAFDAQGQVLTPEALAGDDDVLAA